MRVPASLLLCVARNVLAPGPGGEKGAGGAGFDVVRTASDVKARLAGSEKAKVLGLFHLRHMSRTPTCS